MTSKYRITNYGNTRTVYIKGQSWEISKHSTIETTDKEVADAWERLPFVDIEVVDVKEPKKKIVKKKKKKTTKKKATVRVKKKKKTTTVKKRFKKIKHHKKIRRKLK